MNSEAVVKLMKLGYTAAKSGVEFEELVDLMNMERC